MIVRIAAKCFCAGILCTVLAGCDADFLKSDKRIVARQAVIYQARLSQGKFDDAIKEFHHKNFIWEKYNPDKKKSKKKTSKKRNDSKAFMESIRGIDDRTAVFVHQKSVTKLNEDKYVLKGSFQVRGNTASSQSNTRWEYSMVWVRSGKNKWRIKEIKELNKRTYKRS